MSKQRDFSNSHIQLSKLTEENQHLKNLLREKVGTTQPLSDEESICVVQIKILREMASVRELTLEEVKKLDLLVKNLRIVRGSVIVQEKEDKTKTWSTEKLLELIEE